LPLAATLGAPSSRAWGAGLPSARDIIEPVVVVAIPVALFTAVVSVIGLISEVVGIVQQTPVQRGIDAHPVRVTATYAAYDDGGSKFQDPTYTLAYLYEGEAFSTPLRSLPGNYNIGDELCAEIDAEQPENGRVCGTRGGLADAKAGLRTGGLLLGAALLVLLVIWVSSGSPGARRINPARRRGNRKPARRQS
jgi:hypothetical protein